VTKDLAEIEEENRAAVAFQAPPSALQVLLSDPDRLNTLNVDVLERLMALEKDMRRDAAEVAYHSALADFQYQCPVIEKTKKVMNKDGKTVRYRYAPIESILQQVREQLRGNGFSYTFDSEPREDGIQVTCTLTHNLGHAKSATRFIPFISGFGTNAAQDAGSAHTYGRRLSFGDVTGIATGDQDDDAASSGPETASLVIAHVKAVRENWSSVVAIKQGIAAMEAGGLHEAAEAWFELDNETKTILFVAPSKGGIFTTHERSVMQSSEFRKAHFGEDA